MARRTTPQPRGAASALEPEVAHAASKALRALARSDRSRAELLAALERDSGEDVARQAVDALQAQGLIDDGAAARRLAERWLARDLLAPALVRERLRGRGFDDATSDGAVAAQIVDERAAARALALRTGVDPQHPQRLPRRLLRAGYDEELVREVLRALGAGDG
jgi:SOS response regulatory protein OraA/RecX